MIKIEIKPLSVNGAWKGRRFKTGDYKQYEHDVYYLLPRGVKIPPTGLLQISLEFGLSSLLADGDNPIKPFVDILQKRYNFNDRRIKRWFIDNYDVKPGEEYVKFELTQLQR